MRAQASGGRALHDPARVQHTAQRGVAGPGEPLPYLDRIQRLFGRHDVSGARAHSDPAAAGAARALGAEAFTTGQDVAFAGTPSLHTAAHEAAHTVQQQAGVQPKDGMSAEGDTDERHADAVADRVIRGESAEALLDEAPLAAGTPAVQRTVTIGKLDPTKTPHGPGEGEKESTDSTTIPHGPDESEKESTATTYGPDEGERSLESLIVLVNRELARMRQDPLDESQQSKLHELWKSGVHHFHTVEELIHQVVWGSRLTLLEQPRGYAEEEEEEEEEEDDDDEQKQKRRRAQAPDGGIWYVSTQHVAAVPPGRHRNTKNVFKETEHDGETEQAKARTRAKFLVQCAVAGGEMYRLVLGGHQPEVIYTELGGEPTRASSNVEGFQPWPAKLVTNDDNHIISHADSPDSEARASDKPITGLMSVYTMALFLGDQDLSKDNLGLVETQDAFEAVKIDPEVSLSSLHLFPPYDSEQDVHSSLIQPERHDLTLGEDADTGDHGGREREKPMVFSQEFASVIAGSFEEAALEAAERAEAEGGKEAENGGEADRGEDEESDRSNQQSEDGGDAEQKLRRLLHGGPMRQEMLRTVDSIVNTPPEKFYGVIDRCISPEFESSICILKDAVARRLRTFQAVAADPAFRGITTSQSQTNAPQLQNTREQQSVLPPPAMSNQLARAPASPSSPLANSSAPLFPRPESGLPCAPQIAMLQPIYRGRPGSQPMSYSGRPSTPSQPPQFPPNSSAMMSSQGPATHAPSTRPTPTPQPPPGLPPPSFLPAMMPATQAAPAQQPIPPLAHHHLPPRGQQLPLAQAHPGKRDLHNRDQDPQGKGKSQGEGKGKSQDTAKKRRQAD
jgi:hypothetical protein